MAYPCHIHVISMSYACHIHVISMIPMFVKNSNFGWWNPHSRPPQPGQAVLLKSLTAEAAQRVTWTYLDHLWLPLVCASKPWKLDGFGVSMLVGVLGEPTSGGLQRRLRANWRCPETGDPKIIQVIVDIGDFSWGKAVVSGNYFSEKQNMLFAEHPKKCHM